MNETMPPEPARDGPIGIIVVNFGAQALIEQNLGWLTGADPSARVVIVDNFRSVDDAVATAELTRRLGWTLVPTDHNLGFGAGVNRGAAAADALGCPVFMVLNPDVAIDRAALEDLHAAALADPNAMISPTILGPDGLVWSKLGRIDMTAGRVLGSGQDPMPAWLSGACLAVHRDLWARIGGFDEDYFLYWEDVDLSYRCVRLGGTLSVRENVIVHHDIGATQGERGGKSRTYYFHNCRNRLLFAAKHVDAKTQLTWLLRTPADARRVINRGIPPKYHRIRHAAWPALRGCLAGLWWIAVVAARGVWSRRPPAAS